MQSKFCGCDNYSFLGSASFRGGVWLEGISLSRAGARRRRRGGPRLVGGGGGRPWPGPAPLGRRALEAGSASRRLLSPRHVPGPMEGRGGEGGGGRGWRADTCTPDLFLLFRLAQSLLHYFCS